MQDEDYASRGRRSPRPPPTCRLLTPPRRARAPLLLCAPPQPDAPLSLSGTSESLATLVWQVACKEGQLDKVQDELRQVRGPRGLAGHAVVAPGAPRRQRRGEGSRGAAGST
jgi:hypothetical protein